MSDNLEKFLQNIDSWLATSTSNYYWFLFVSGLIIILSALIIVYFYLKIGKADERTELIRAKIGTDMLIGFFVVTVVFVANLSSGLQYIQQLYLPFIAFACVIGAMRSAVRYNRSK